MIHWWITTRYPCGDEHHGVRAGGRGWGQQALKARGEIGIGAALGQIRRIAHLPRRRTDTDTDTDTEDAAELDFLPAALKRQHRAVHHRVERCVGRGRDHGSERVDAGGGKSGAHGLAAAIDLARTHGDAQQLLYQGRHSRKDLWLPSSTSLACRYALVREPSTG
ncbi:MAG: hypothetical protein H7330_10760 [Hymenobacteraceae bacterium]|nr:hypothetical protein [Hymenobacteraceae bacterium]